MRITIEDAYEAFKAGFMLEINDGRYKIKRMPAFEWATNAVIDYTEEQTAKLVV